MRSASNRTRNVFVLGLLALAIVVALGVVVFHRFFASDPDSHEIGWVLEVTGAGWALQGDGTRLLQVGDRLPSGATIIPKTNDEFTTLTICDFEGKALRFVGRDGAQTLPVATSSNLGSKLWQRIAQSYEPKDIHAISRGADDQRLSSSVGLINDRGTVDLSQLLVGWPPATYPSRFTRQMSKHFEAQGATEKINVVWNPSDPHTAQSPKLSPGLYQIEVQSDDTAADPIECLLLVCSHDDFPKVDQEFAQCLAQINAWPQAVRDSVGEKNRRACVRAIADTMQPEL